MSDQVCYLCSELIAENPSKDHVVPKQAIKRAQPRAKGYDYAGTIPTHEDCNNRFGPETRYNTARRVLAILLDEGNFVQGVHPADPNIPILALDGTKFEWMNADDRQFFKFLGGADQTDLPPVDFFKGRQKGNPKRDAMLIAFSVLAKSAAALLVSRHLIEIPASWWIYASAYWDEGVIFDLDESVGATTPFDDGLKVWIRPASKHDWQVIYKSDELVLIFLFSFSNADSLKGLREILTHNDVFGFEGRTLNKLLTVGWKKV